jgi:hypothetical protein
MKRHKPMLWLMSPLAQPGIDVYCVDSPDRSVAEQARESHRLRLRASDGKTYSFIPDESAAEMFADARVRQPQITALLPPNDRLKSIEDLYFVTSPAMRQGCVPV